MGNHVSEFEGNKNTLSGFEEAASADLEAEIENVDGGSLKRWAMLNNPHIESGNPGGI